MYKVFGYTDDCRDFSQTFSSFVKAINAYRKNRDWCVIFIQRGAPNTCKYVSSFSFKRMGW